MVELNDGIEFELASPEDAGEIYALMELAQRVASCPDFYVISSLERVEWKLRENSFAYLARSCGELVGFYIFEMPGLDKEENLGYEIGLEEDELTRVLCMGSVAVNPAFRRRGLQRRLATLGEAEGLRRGFDIFLATADPRNTPSVRNFILGGYDIVMVKESFYSPNVPRAVFMKRADGQKMHFESAGGVTLNSVS